MSRIFYNFPFSPLLHASHLPALSLSALINLWSGWWSRRASIGLNYILLLFFHLSTLFVMKIKKISILFRFSHFFLSYYNMSSWLWKILSFHFFFRFAFPLEWIFTLHYILEKVKRKLCMSPSNLLTQISDSRKIKARSSPCLHARDLAEIDSFKLDYL